MSFRIDVIHDPDRTTVRVAGTLTADALPELLRSVEGEPSSAVLDLTELRSVDAVAGRALRGLRNRGARLVGASPYVELLVNAAETRDEQGR